MISRVYRKLGILEAEGVLKAIRHLAFQSGANIDSSRIGMHGWSFGGFLTIATMTSQMVGNRIEQWKKKLSLSQKNLVKCGAAVAPVTDWRLYDTIYTERYMAKYFFSKVNWCTKCSGRRTTRKVIREHLWFRERTRSGIKVSSCSTAPGLKSKK